MTDGRPTVLVVDDQADIVRIYTMELGDAYDVRTALGGERAIEMLDGSLDVVLLDRRMPGTPGEEVLAAIRSRALDVRVAMITAVDPDLDSTGMDVDAYLVKPVDETDVRGVVDELLAERAREIPPAERHSIGQRLEVLRSTKSPDELAESKECEALQERATELDTADDERN